VQHFSTQAPTLAFHASLNHSFGKGSLIQLLRQFSSLHSDKKQISVGFIGYPNVGKSSIINCLKKGKVCKVAPIPGETKVWQYVTLMRRIYLIDCPGIVPVSAHDSTTSTVLKGVVRVENLSTPSEHIPELLQRVRPEYLERTYDLPSKSKSESESGERAVQTWEADEFLDVLARKSGKLLKGGEPDRETVSKMVLNDWIRGRIPYFVRPPEREEDDAKGKEGRVKEKGVKSVKGVEQPIEKIVVGSKFLEDDERRLDENEVEEGGDEQYEDDEEGEEEEEASASEDTEEPVQEQLGWDEVFATVSGGAPVPDAKAEGVDEGVEDDEEEWGGIAEDEEEGEPEASEDDDNADDSDTDSQRRTHKKEPRMKTNKRKATNFFTIANVKNKNREKRIPQIGGQRRGGGGGSAKRPKHK
jgi:nuclear GTP-binding protein